METSNTLEDDKTKILIVDDRPDKLLVFSTILAELRQTVTTANSGEEALKLVLEHDFAVILLDVNMPGLDGLETAALIRNRKKSAHTPIIFITSYADEMHATKGYSLGAVDYILSPVVPEVLRTKVRVFVELFQMAERIKQQAEERVLLAHEQAARAAAEEVSRRSQFLAEASALLSGALDLRSRMGTLARLALRTLADVCGIVLIDESGGPTRVEIGWLRADGELLLHPSLVSELGDSPLKEAITKTIESSHPMMVEGPEEPLQQGHHGTEDGIERVVRRLRTVATFPLRARNRMTGVLCLGLTGKTRAFSDVETQLAIELADRAAGALDNASLYGKLQENDRRKDEFLAMLAHELRNPLAPIQNATNLLQLAANDPERSRWAREVIHRQVQHMVRLLDDLLDVSRITRGKIDLRLASMDMAAAVAGAVETSRPLIEARHQRLEVSIPRQSLHVNADRTRIEQVITNLLNNAAKFTDEGGSIWVNVEREGQFVVCRVRDSGIGIASDMLTSIFDLFTQVAHARSIQGSLGIGLTLVRSLVEAHGGTAYATSKGIGHGSEFVVRLPLMADKKIEAPAVTPAHQADAPLRVMVIDDDVDVCESTAELLRMQGYEVRAFTDGHSALTEFERFIPDAVLLDISMPEMDGYEVARRMRSMAAGQKMRLIAASGYGRSEDLERSRRAGFDAHLVKPVDPLVLCSHLTERFLAASESNRIAR